MTILSHKVTKCVNNFEIDFKCHDLKLRQSVEITGDDGTLGFDLSDGAKCLRKGLSGAQVWIFLWLTLVFPCAVGHVNDNCLMLNKELGLCGAKLGYILVNLLAMMRGVSVNYDCLSGRLYRIMCKMKCIHGLIDVLNVIAGRMNDRVISYLVFGACIVMRNDYCDRI